MKSVLWLAVGIVLGFAAAHQANETPAGRAFFADVRAGSRRFVRALADGYRSREAELRSAA